jgi:retron-type reverse transcriptase
MCFWKFSVTFKPNKINAFQSLKHWQKLRGGGGTIPGVSKILSSHTFEELISMDNLLEAWGEFVVGKRSRADVQVFELHLMDHLFDLHQDLRNKTYKHSSYEAFVITDPKRRLIHKASLCDRILHHALYRKLYPFFDRTFISDSFSCRNEKGMYKAMDRFRSFAFKVSQNHTKICWVLKCDIKQFFASIDHFILFATLATYIVDRNILWLFEKIIESFATENRDRVGLPLGNLTSQLFSNIYMNRFDQFVKHKLKMKYYIRYADDFVFFSQDKKMLASLIPAIRSFLLFDLHLTLHPNKIYLKTIASGVDFLGWVHFPDHRILRAVTKRRMLNRIHTYPSEETIQSYLGLLSHGNMKGLHLR